jgi:alpha-amylase/alpha-mannosidase (GH57 family)
MATGKLRVILLWHMHQPLYKDLVTGEYRLPWVRMHALKDYYGMVKLLDEFPNVHQNFNLVPSLVSQIEDYASGTFRDPFYEVVAKPADELTPEDRKFALQYLFQAHPERMIARYPRYKTLFEKVRSVGPDPTRAERLFTVNDFTDLQVLSQLAWFDEFFLQEPEIRALVAKGEGFSHDDKRTLLAWEQKILSSILPAYSLAAKRGGVELSATPYYHPILPLVCDTNEGAVSSPGLPLPTTRFRHPEDAEMQIGRAMEAHEKVFGVRPKGMWPSEGSVSEEVLALASDNGLQWMATDEGVLGRTLGTSFEHDGNGHLRPESASQLYNIYRYEQNGARMNLIFRDHRMSDLIGFVYAGMPARDAAAHLISSIRTQAAPVLESGRDAVVPIILDGENAWETFEESGREFLRRFYDHLERDKQIEAVTVSEAIERHQPNAFGRLDRLVPGSWINANFNVWIGAPEDNKSWDYLSDARDYYDLHAVNAKPEARKLAFEELLIAEGSDWNWWYGPEHHSANDSDFDELYRRHLSNVYQALGAVPPDYLARPIAGGVSLPTLVSQTAYVHPRITGYANSYFEWMGSAMFTSDRRTGSMHGKQFLFEAVHSGIDEQFLYGRLDFAAASRAGELSLQVQFSVAKPGLEAQMYRLDTALQEGNVADWVLHREGKRTQLASAGRPNEVEVALQKIFAFKIPLAALGAEVGSSINLRFQVFRGNLPVDALPVEGSLEIRVEPEDVLIENSYAPHK